MRWTGPESVARPGVDGSAGSMTVQSGRSTEQCSAASDVTAVTGPVRVTGPGRKPKFREDDVIREAYAQGLDRFTLAGIARHLGVVPSALYRLFPSRDVVVEKCLHRVADDFRLPSPGMSWQEILRSWGAELWRVISSYDGLAALMMQDEYSRHLMDGPGKEYSGALLATGKARGQVVFALRTIAYISVGAGLRAEGAPRGDVIGDPTDWRWQERHRHGIPVEDLWTTVPGVQVKIELVIEGLELHWTEADLPAGGHQ